MDKFSEFLIVIILQGKNIIYFRSIIFVSEFF
jgi:hypothetical protein